MTVFGCFERGLATRRAPPLPVRGPVIEAASGLWAAFSMEVDDDRLQALRFECASCTTLIACCQALAEMLPGRRLHDCTMDATTLAYALSGIPPLQRDRAALAAGALRAALEAIDRIETSPNRQAQGRPA